MYILSITYFFAKIIIDEIQKSLLQKHILNTKPHCITHLELHLFVMEISLVYVFNGTKEKGW